MVGTAGLADEGLSLHATRQVAGAALGSIWTLSSQADSSCTAGLVSDSDPSARAFAPRFLWRPHRHHALALHLRQAVQGTLALKLPNMLGTIEMIPRRMREHRD